MKIEIAAALLMEQIVRETYSGKRSSAIQPLQWSILRYLSEVSADATDITSIGKYVGVTTAPVSRAVTTLERRGLVTKGEHPRSRRSISVAITEKGRAALQEDPILKIAARIDLLNHNEKMRLVESLRQLMLLDNRL